MTGRKFGPTDDDVEALADAMCVLLNDMGERTARVDELQKALVEMHGRWRASEDALYQFEYPPDPKMLRRVADEIDCGLDCEYGQTEWDTNAFVCSKLDKDGCPGDDARQLREFADAIEARSALEAAMKTEGR